LGEEKICRLSFQTPEGSGPGRGEKKTDSEVHRYGINAHRGEKKKTNNRGQVYGPPQGVNDESGCQAGPPREIKKRGPSNEGKS